MQNYLLPKLESSQDYCEQFNSDESDYPPLPLRNSLMRRTFHFDCPNGKFNVSECADDSQITVSINDTEINIDFDTFSELCELRYTLNLHQKVI